MKCGDVALPSGVTSLLPEANGKIGRILTALLPPAEEALHKPSS